MRTSTISTLFRILACVFLIGCDEKVERCEEGGDGSAEECAEFRVTTDDTQTTYILGDYISIISDRGTFPSTGTVDLNFLPSSDLETCGGTLVSKAFVFKAQDSKGEIIDREDIKDKPLFTRMDTDSYIETRDETVFAIIMRAPPSSEVFYLGSEKFTPKGPDAIDKTDVNWYVDETFAGFYLINAANGPSADCSPYLTLAEEEAAAEAFTCPSHDLS